MLLASPDVARSQTPTPTPNGLCPADLAPAIATITNRPAVQRTRWGVLVQTLASSGQPTTLYEQEAGRYFTPASTTKLLTSAAALTRLGREFRIRTSVYRLPSPTGQVVLRLVGRGDPTITDAQLTQLATQVATALNQQGIRQIDQLIADDQYFQGNPVNPTWEWEDTQVDSGAPVTSFILNQNVFGITLIPKAVGQPLGLTWDNPAIAQQWRVENRSTTVPPNAPESINLNRDSRGVLSLYGQLQAGSEPAPVGVAVVDPTANFLTSFQRALTAQSLRVGQTAVATTALPAEAVEIAAIASPPLSSLITSVNQNSDNLYAEVLLRSLGVAYATQTRQPNRDTTALGLAAVSQTLTQLGVDSQTYDQADGSGLSRRNLISPEALVQTLQAINRSPDASLFRSTLPVAGVSGTLRNRFRNTAAAGLVTAKTGTLTGVVALAGYVTPPNYPPLVFSVIANQSNQSTSTLRQSLDDIVLLLMRLRSCN